MQERGQAQPFDAQRPGPVPGRRDASGGRGAGRGGRDAQPPSARQRGRRRRRRLLLLAVFITVHTPETRHQLHGGGRRRRPFDVADKADAAAAAASDGGPSAPRSRVRVGNNGDNLNDGTTETTVRRARVRRANLFDVAGQGNEWSGVFPRLLYFFYVHSSPNHSITVFVFYTQNTL